MEVAVTTQLINLIKAGFHKRKTNIIQNGRKTVTLQRPPSIHLFTKHSLRFITRLGPRKKRSQFVPSRALPLIILIMITWMSSNHFKSKCHSQINLPTICSDSLIKMMTTISSKLGHLTQILIKVIEVGINEEGLVGSTTTGR